jgi:hypothetical protein
MRSPLKNLYKFNDQSLFRIGWVLFLALASIHAFSLNYPLLNGDEALNGIIAAEETLKAFAGKPLNLTPIVTYVGPIDTWLVAMLHLLISGLTSWTPAPWSLRIGPLLFFLFGTIYLSFELKKKDPRIAAVFLALIAICSMSWVHARISWSSSYVLGGFSALLAETFRARRTNQPRPLPIGIYSGLLIEFHPTAALGILTLVGMNWRLFLESLRADRKKWALSFLVFFGLSLPEILHFPPPITATHERGVSFLDELSYLAGTITGRRSLLMVYGKDPLPIFVSVMILICFIGLMGSRWKTLWRNKTKTENRALVIDTTAVLALSATLVFFCYHSRSLSLLGHERYLNALVPLWAYLVSEALVTLSGHSARRWKTSLWFLGICVLLAQGRILYPLVVSMRNPDPTQKATEWLMQECPKSTCVAYAENFWNYWPILYYSNLNLEQKIDLNVMSYNWRTMPQHPRAGREAAGCWFSSGTDLPRPKTWRKRIEFLGQGNHTGQTCYLGIE